MYPFACSLTAWETQTKKAVSGSYLVNKNTESLQDEVRKDSAGDRLESLPLASHKS